MHLAGHDVVADRSECSFEDQLLLAHAHFFVDVVVIRELTRWTLLCPQWLRVFNISEHLACQVEALNGRRPHRGICPIHQAVLAAGVVRVRLADGIDVLLRESSLRLLDCAVFAVADGLQVLDAGEGRSLVEALVDALAVVVFSIQMRHPIIDTRPCMLQLFVFEMKWVARHSRSTTHA